MKTKTIKTPWNKYSGEQRQIINKINKIEDVSGESVIEK
jgi:hypothetical protein